MTWRVCLAQSFCLTAAALDLCTLCRRSATRISWLAADPARETWRAADSPSPSRHAVVFPSSPSVSRLTFPCAMPRCCPLCVLWSSSCDLEGLSCAVLLFPHSCVLAAPDSVCVRRRNGGTFRGRTGGCRRSMCGSTRSVRLPHSVSLSFTGRAELAGSRSVCLFFFLLCVVGEAVVVFLRVTWRVCLLHSFCLTARVSLRHLTCVVVGRARAVTLGFLFHCPSACFFFCFCVSWTDRGAAKEPGQRARAQVVEPQGPLLMLSPSVPTARMPP